MRMKAADMIAVGDTLEKVAYEHEKQGCEACCFRNTPYDDICPVLNCMDGYYVLHKGGKHGHEPRRKS